MSLRGSRSGRAGLEYALYALVCAAPLAIGSVHATTQVLLAAASTALLVATAITAPPDKGVRIPPFAWIPIAALAWTLLQLVPLPLGILRLLSPHAASLREETGAHLAPLTLDVAASTLELCKLVASTSVLLVGAELLRKRGRRTANVLAALGGLVVVLLWAHRLTGAREIYGFYEIENLPGSGFFAPFVNGNNAASLLVLCALAAAGSAFGRNDTRGPLFIMLAFAAGASTLSTMSRGGAIGLACGALFFVTALASHRYGRVRALALSLSVIVTLGAGGLLIADGLRGRFEQSSPGATLTDNQKTRGWLAGLRLADQYALSGVGRGAFEAVAASTRVDEEGVRLVYPENVVVQVLSEWGWPMGLALLAALVGGFVQTLRRCRLDAPLLGLAAGVIAVAVHELFDFGLEFPGVSLPVTLAVAAIVACAEADDRTRRSPRPRLKRPALVAIALCGFACTIAGWSARTHTLAADLQNAGDLSTAIARHPASAELEMLVASRAIAQHDTSALHHLNRAMRLQPAASQPHIFAALELEQLHRYRQAALEYRLARERGASIEDDLLVHRIGRFALDAAVPLSQSYTNLGRLYAAYKRYDEATLAYERAAELDQGAAPRRAWLSWMPLDRQPHVLEVMERMAQDDDELAVVINGWASLKDFTHAERTASAAMQRFPKSSVVAVATARMRLAKDDVDGARQAIGRTMRFDDVGRVHAEEVLVDIAKRSGDLDQAAAAEARLRLLRAKVHMDEPASGGSHP